MTWRWFTPIRSFWQSESSVADAGARLRNALVDRDDGAFDAHYGGRAGELGYHYWTSLASAAAKSLALGNVELVHGSVFDVDWRS